MTTPVSDQKKAKATSPPPDKCHFLTLPPEIRLEIYTLVLNSFAIQPDKKRLKEPPLLQVCKLIRNEGVDIFNKRMSAILDQEQADVKVAETRVRGAQKREDRIAVASSRRIELIKAAAMTEKSHLMLRRQKQRAESVSRKVELERRKLWAEGFQV